MVFGRFKRVGHILFCKNTTGSCTDLEGNDLKAYLLDAGETNVDLFDMKTDAEHWALFDKLAMGKVNARDW